MAAAGFLGFYPREVPKTSTPSLPEPQPEFMQDHSFSASQAKTLLATYTGPTGENLQALQAMRGSAASQSSYIPHALEIYIKRAQLLTRLPASNLTDAKRNVAGHTRQTYAAMARQIGQAESTVENFFNRQYLKNEQRTRQMIAQTIQEWRVISRYSKRHSKKILIFF